MCTFWLPGAWLLKPVHPVYASFSQLFNRLRQKNKDSCVQVSEVRKIRVGRSKNIFILDFFFITNVQRL